MISVYFQALYAMLALGFITWIVSLVKRDVSIVDSIWSLMILVSAFVYFWHNNAVGFRETLIFSLVLIWALRLSVHLTWRNWGQPEDNRYQKIREKYSPRFALKSLGIIFGFQALLAWLVSLPLLVVLSTTHELSLLDAIAILLWLVGMGFESVADFQLHRFKSDNNNTGKVLDSGLWRYSRHPNYFGEFLIWWGIFLITLSNPNSWWAIFSPIIVTAVLLKMTGIPLTEKGLVENRPGYSEYIKRTSAFVPWLPAKENQ